jgi:hypothetical protein
VDISPHRFIGQKLELPMWLTACARGSAFNDRITGSNSSNVIEGGAGVRRDRTALFAPGFREPMTITMTKTAVERRNKSRLCLIPGNEVEDQSEPG